LPEGDTVWLTCRRLHAVLAGRALVTADLRVARLATVDLRGVVMREVASRGKHQLLRLEDGWTLHTHMRMDGTWWIRPVGVRRGGGPAHQIRVLLETADNQAIGYRLPVVELLRTDAESERLGHLGPDLLGADWNADEALARLQSDPNRAIGEALLDQRNLAGLGTLYRAEVLYLTGVHPRRPVGRVANLARMVELAHDLLHANRNTFDQVTTGNARRGEQHWVFQRPNRPCRRCGSAIRAETFGPAGAERPSYWCPACQPE